MNILISHVYSSQNRGDAALTSILISEIKRIYSDAKITILTREGTELAHQFENVPQQPSWMFFILGTNSSGQVIKLIRASYIIGLTLLAAIIYRFSHYRLWLPRHLKPVMRAYYQADLIIPVGGGYLRSTTKSGLSLVNLILLLHPLVLGKLLKKPTVLYSQSVGPFNNNLEAKLVAFVLRRMDLILIREDVSLKLLHKLGVRDNVQRSVDCGFLLTAGAAKIDLRPLLGVPANDLLVGVTVRKWLKGEAQANYESAVAQALDHLLAHYSASVVFIPQVTSAILDDDDRQASQAVFNRMNQQSKAHVIKQEYNHHQIKALYQNLDLLIGTRFHSVIFALTSYIPAIAIEYEHKTSGIMADLGLDKWLLDINTITAPALINKIEAIITDQKNYREHLARVLPPYIDKAESTAQLLLNFAPNQ